MEMYIAQALFALIQIWANHANKPPGWVPTEAEVNDMISMVDAATPEAEKAAARARLGIPDPPPG